MKIPLASVGLRPKDIEAAQSVLNSGQLTMGNQVSQFEKAMAKYLGVKYFIMVNSGSSANLAIFEALLRPSIGKPILNTGDGVLVPAVAWLRPGRRPQPLRPLESGTPAAHYRPARGQR